MWLQEHKKTLHYNFVVLLNATNKRQHDVLFASRKELLENLDLTLGKI